MKLKGIDISYCQRGVDYKKAKAAGVEFAIVRSGYLNKVDDMLYVHLSGCRAAGIPVGIYVYAMAKTKLDALAEARSCIKAIAGYEIDYPVFYDMEDNRLLDGISKGERTENALMFLEEIKRAGYYPAVYVNPAWLEDYLEKDKLMGKYDIWLAAWTENPTVSTKYDYSQKMWQWGLDKVDGIGAVDGNICYVNYPEVIKSGGHNLCDATAETVPVQNTAGAAEFKSVSKKYRCLGKAVNRRKLASGHSAVVGTCRLGEVYDAIAEVFDGGKLKFLQFADGYFSMYVDQIGDVLFEEETAEKAKTDFSVGDKVKITAPYAAAAYDKSAEFSAAVGEVRYIVKKISGKDAAYPFQLGVKAGSAGVKNTTGFANENGIKKA